MIAFHTLDELDYSLEEFMKNAIEFNLKYFEENPNYNTQYNGFYSYMEGLIQFGQMIFTNRKHQIKIYKEETNRNKYYAIDSTGLSYGYIYGPKHQISNNNLETKDLFYGFYCMEKCVYKYDCIDDFNSKSYNERNIVNIEILRKEYLPLMKGGNTFESFRYFSTSNQKDCHEYGPTIYQSDNKSFYIPFIELIRKELDLNGWNLNVTPKFEKEYINFIAKYTWSRRKYTYWKKWEGKITYETFEIVEIKLTEEDSFYDW